MIIALITIAITGFIALYARPYQTMRLSQAVEQSPPPPHPRVPEPVVTVYPDHAFCLAVIAFFGAPLGFGLGFHILPLLAFALVAATFGTPLWLAVFEHRRNVNQKRWLSMWNSYLQQREAAFYADTLPSPEKHRRNSELQTELNNQRIAQTYRNDLAQILATNAELKRRYEQELNRDV